MGIQHAMISLAEKNIHFAILSWQCSNLENTLKGYNINLQTYLNSKAPLALLKLFFKLMTIKRDLMANKKEEKVEEEKKEGEEDVKAEGDETKEEEAKDELGNEKPKP